MYILQFSDFQLPSSGDEGRFERKRYSALRQPRLSQIRVQTAVPSTAHRRRRIAICRRRTTRCGGKGDVRWRGGKLPSAGVSWRIRCSCGCLQRGLLRGETATQEERSLTVVGSVEGFNHSSSCYFLIPTEASCGNESPLKLRPPRPRPAIHQI